MYKHEGWHGAQSLQAYDNVLTTLNQRLIFVTFSRVDGSYALSAEGQEEVIKAIESLPPGGGKYIEEKYKESTGYNLQDVLDWNLDRSHHERAMRQLRGFDAQRQARVLDEALKQDAEWGGLASADVDALLAATANLTPYQAEAVRSEFARIEPNDGPLMPRLVAQLPFAARVKVLDNLGLTNAHEIACLIHANQSADEVLELFKLLSPERRVGVKQEYVRLTDTEIYDRVFVRHTTYSGFNAGGTVTERRTLRKDLEPPIEPVLPEG
jgi:hypothetical protein